MRLIPRFQNWLAAVHPEDRQAVTAEIERVIEQRREFLMEYRVQWPDGTIRWIRDAGKLLLDEQGRPLRMLGILLDITERKRAEKALEQEAIRRRILIEQSSDGIVVLDEYGKVYRGQPACMRRCSDIRPRKCSQLHVWDWDVQWSRQQVLDMIRRLDDAGVQFETAPPAEGRHIVRCRDQFQCRTLRRAKAGVLRVPRHFAIANRPSRHCVKARSVFREHSRTFRMSW